MKKYFYELTFFLAFFGCPLMTSCGEDDEEPSGGEEPVETSIVNPSKVFTAGLPKSVGGNTFTTDAKGRVVKMKREGYTVTFDYSSLTRAPKADVVMTVKDDDEELVCNLTLNDDGFVSFCDEYSHSNLDGDEHQTWKFAYDSDGHLIKMVRSEGGNETTTITYVNGDIVETRTVSEDDPEDASHYGISYTIEYEKGNIFSIENKGGIMFFDEAFHVDMDEMINAYYAGLLGMPTKNLPLLWFDDDNYVCYIKWYIDEEGFPTRFFPDADDNRYVFIEW